MKFKDLAGFTIFFLLVSILIKCSFAIPPVAAEFYGWVIVNGEYAPPGTNITVFDISGVKCGETVLKEEGNYGFLSCAGDDPSTPEDEGAHDNEGLTFYVNDFKINTQNSIYWKPGSFREVNLIVGDVDRAIPLLEEPKPPKFNQGLYIMFLLVLLLIAAFILAIVASKIWKAIKRLHKETEALKIDEL